MVIFQQVIVMFMSVVVVTILGTVASDGIQSIFDKASEGGRIKLFKYVFFSSLLQQFNPPLISLIFVHDLIQFQSVNV